MSPTTVQVIRALGATLAVQSLVTMASLTVPVFAAACTSTNSNAPSAIDRKNAKQVR